MTPRRKFRADGFVCGLALVVAWLCAPRHQGVRRDPLNRTDTSTGLQRVAVPIEIEVLTERYWVVLVLLAAMVGSGMGGFDALSLGIRMVMKP